MFTDYDEEEEADWENDDGSDGRTPLDRTIDRIGMGAPSRDSWSLWHPLTAFVGRLLPVVVTSSLWFWFVLRFVGSCPPVTFFVIYAGWMADNVQLSPPS